MNKLITRIKKQPLYALLIVGIVMALFPVGYGLRTALASTPIIALQPVCDQNLPVSYAAAHDSEPEHRFIAAEEWNVAKGTRFSYMKDLLTEGPVNLFVACGDPSPLGAQAWGWYVDAAAAQEGVYTLFPPQGSITITADKSQYVDGDTVIFTITRTSGPYDRTLLAGVSADRKILDLSTGQTVHTVSAHELGAGSHTALVDSGPNVHAQTTFTVLPIATPTAQPTATTQPTALPTSTPIATPTTGPQAPTAISSCTQGQATNPGDGQYQYHQENHLACWVSTQFPNGWGFALRSLGDQVQYPPRDFAQVDCKTAKSEAQRLAHDAGQAFLGGPDCGPEFNLYGLYSGDQIPADLQAKITEKRLNPTTEVLYLGKKIMIDGSVADANRHAIDFNKAPVNPDDEVIWVLQPGYVYNVIQWGGPESTSRQSAGKMTIVTGSPAKGARAFFGFWSQYVAMVMR